MKTKTTPTTSRDLAILFAALIAVSALSLGACCASKPVSPASTGTSGGYVVQDLGK